MGFLGGSVGSIGVWTHPAYLFCCAPLPLASSAALKLVFFLLDLGGVLGLELPPGGWAEFSRERVPILKFPILKFVGRLN